MLSEFLPFIVSGIATGSVLGLAGTGLVLTYKTSGIFNFGHGAVAAAAAYTFYYLEQDKGWPWWAALLVVVLVLGPLFGLVMEAISKPLSEQRAALKIVATVGLILVVSGLATAKYGYDPLTLPQYLPKGTETFRVGGVNITYAQLTIVIVSLVVVSGLYLLFKFSRVGLAMRAVVDDPELTTLHGTNARQVKRFAWMIGSVFAALSGVLIAPITGIDATGLTFLVVQAFGAAAIGAFSSIPMTYVGALVIGVASSISTKYVVTVPQLSGLPSSLPFVFLVLVLLVLPRWRLNPPARAEARPTVPWHAPSSARLTTGLIVVVVLALVPTFAGVNLPYFTVGLTQAILLLSLGLLVRTAGLVSLCQAGFAAIGAAAFSQLAVEGHLPWLLAVLIGALVCVPIAALLALPAIRLSGLFLALITLGFGLMCEQLLYPMNFFFTSEGTGRSMPRPGGFTGDKSYYYVVLLFLIAAAVIMIVIHRSRLGRVLGGLSESPLAVRTLGLNVNMTRMIVFCIAGFIAGIAGILYGSSVHYAVLGDTHYAAYNSLVLIATLAVVPGREPWYALIAGVSAVIPAYLHIGNSTESWLNVLFGFFAVVVGMQGGAQPMPMVVRRAVEAVAPHWRRSYPPSPDGSEVAERAKARREVVAAKAGIEVRSLTIKYGGRTAVDNLSFTAPMGQITGLIGPNGAGKTTTFNALSGLLSPSEGQVYLHGQDVSKLSPASRGRVGLGRTFQLMQLAESLTVAQNVALGVESAFAGSNLRGQLIASPSEQRHTRDAVEDALALCGISDIRDMQAGALSTGQRRLVELARCLSGSFDMLLLDEPSSGLDVGETEKFGQTLVDVVRDRGCGILLVEHDMALVLRICKEINVLDFGKFLFRGTPIEIARSEVVQAAYLGSADNEVIDEESHSTDKELSL
ncbi:branched-chain amino acid ABC transporter permease/ATP-binding protein [Jatrophihabitans sp.]|uniref:branched-chain amino acid ABC transporter permease/ATP-binding protein n=1 Tax=Jatrophihabitans sp. TaxID=1932789 RepID=UPI0030C65BCA|nr:branched-chain amino acid transporter ATPase/permease [Jatrophihabitans sp.]